MQNAPMMVAPSSAMAPGPFGHGTYTIKRPFFTFLGREFHTTSVFAGLLIAAVGVLFWVTNGLVSMPSLLPTSVSAWLQGQSSLLANIWVDMGAIVVVALVILAIWWRKTSPKN